MLCKIIPFFLLSLVVACNNKEVPAIDVETAFQNPKEVNLSDLATDIQYVALKAPFNLRDASAVIGENIILLQSRYYSMVFVFDRAGNYINSLGETGTSQNQFNQLRKYCDLSPNEKIVLVTDQAQIKLFNVEGDLLESGTMPRGRNFKTRFMGNKHIVVFKPRQQMESDGYQLYIFNHKLEPIDSLFWASGVGEKPRGTSLPPENFYQFNGKVFFRPCEQDTLFEIYANGEIQPSFVFPQAGYKSKIDWIPSGNVIGILLSSLFETEKYLIINTEEADESEAYGWRYGLVIYNKLDGSLYSSKKQKYKYGNSSGRIYVDSLDIWDDMDGLGYYSYGISLNSKTGVLPLRAKSVKNTLETDTTFIPRVKTRRYIEELSNIINASDKRTFIMRIVYFESPPRRSQKNIIPNKEKFVGFSPMKNIRNNHEWEDADWIAGFTYDSSDDTFWIGKYREGIVEHRTREGGLLPDSFETNPKARIEGLAYSEHDNTLWISSPQTGDLFHYNKEGINLGDGFKVGDNERFGAYGLTYDSSDSTLWLCSPFSEIRHYTTNGIRLEGTINHRMLGSDDGRGLTFDPRDNSLWLLNNGPHKLIHIDKNGEELPGTFYFADTLSLPDCVALDFKTNEFWVGNYGAKEYQ